MSAIRTLALAALAATLAAPAARAQTAPSGYQLNLLYTGEAWDNAAGGLRQGALYMWNADARLDVDTAQAFGLPGGHFTVEGFYESHGSLGLHYTGALDQQSPLDAAARTDIARLYQFFYDQALGGTDVRLGIYDLETEFSSTKPMALFLNKNLTWNTALDQSGTMPQNGLVGPGNYPYTPLAVRVRQSLAQGWSLQGAIASGAGDVPNHPTANGVTISPSDGAMGIAELDYTPSSRTKLMAGAWALTAKLPTNLQPIPGKLRTTYGEQGAYLGGATRLYDAGGRKGLDGFVTIGASTGASTNTSTAFNGGLVYTGLFPARPADKIGAAVNINANPPSYRAAQLAAGQSVRGEETGFELTYRAKITDWLTVQPDIQYIINPNYSPLLKNDLVFGLHFEIGHLFDL